MEVVAVAVAVVEAAVEVAERRHHPDPEEQDMERLSLPMWTTNCTDKALTSLQGISGRPESLSLSGTVAVKLRAMISQA